MFTHTLDNKNTIIDPNGNSIVDLTTSIFTKESGGINSYQIKKLSHTFIMRPDKVAFSEYGSTLHTEYILKYTGISNPFTMSDDDVVMIPDETLANGMMVDNNPQTDETNTKNEDNLRLYYKFTNTEFTSDSTTYENLNEMKIASGQPINNTDTNDYYVPYISKNESMPITIRNGRMYFGEDNGLTANNIIEATSVTDIDSLIQAIINGTSNALADSNCMYNGMTLAQFVRASLDK